jgi:cobalamin biosynthesis Mg chelatase CobN
MLAKTIISFAALAASVSAILVTSPTKNEKVDFSKDVTITWTSVNTDPSTFTLELIDQNNVDSPIIINKEVKTSDNKYTLSNFDAPTGSTYKFNFASNDPQNTGILAQSQTFEIVKTAAEESSSSSSSSASSTSTESTESSSSTASATVVTSAVTSSITTTDASGSTTTMKTVSSKTSTASATAETSGANASSSSSPSATATNAAVVLDKTFAVGGGLLAALLMAF